MSEHTSVQRLITLTLPVESMTASRLARGHQIEMSECECHLQLIADKQLDSLTFTVFFSSRRSMIRRSPPLSFIGYGMQYRASSPGDMYLQRSSNVKVMESLQQMRRLADRHTSQKYLFVMQ